MAKETDNPTKEGTAPSLTQRDFALLLAAFECNKNDFVVDYNKFAEKVGLANANSAKASWHGLKKKLDKIAGPKDDATATPNPGGDDTSATKSNKGSKKRKVADAANGDDEETTPAPKNGKRGKKSASPVKEDKEDGEAAVDGEDEVKAEPEE